MRDKTGFKRFISVIISIAIVFSTFAGLLPGSVVFAAETDPEMHIIIMHWHADQTTEKVNATLKSDGSLSCSGLNPDGGNVDDRTGFFDARPNSSETFSGFAVSAGNDCVELHSDAETPNFTVTYDSNVHLVKVHVFYSAKPKLVPGTQMTVGTLDGEIGEYEDTKTQKWSEIDSNLQTSIQKAIDDDRLNELLTGDGTEIDDKYIKLYNTSEGLHTDKTATPVYYDPAAKEPEAGTTKDDVKGAGTRVFDINLEAWYNDQATAKVGLILDASGSMAFISENLEPMQLSLSDGIHTLPDGTTVKANQYLTPDQVNQILDKNLTDNSKLSYSDYAYYIYDTRDFTQEFVPLAYWGGEEQSNKVNPIAHYTFNGSLKEKEKGGSATYIKHAADNSSGKFEEGSVPTYKPEPVFGNKGLDICKTAPAGGVMLGVVPNTNKFTITLDIGSEKTGTEQVQNNTSILLLTDGNITYNLYRGSVSQKGEGTWSNSSKRLKMSETGNSEIINENDIFNADGTTVRTWSFTFDFDKKELTYSGKNSSGKAVSSTKTLTATLDVNNLKIIVGGAEKKFEKYSEVFVKNLSIKDDSDKEIAKYPLTSDLNNTKSGASATFVKQAYMNTSGKFEATELPDTTAQVPQYTDDALNLTQTAKNGGILLDVVPTNKNNFSISFMVKNESSDKPNHGAELVYMGSLDTNNKYYNIYRSQNTSEEKPKGDPRHIRISENSNYGTKASGSNVFNQSGDAWKTVTFTIKNGTVTAYVNGEKDEDSGGSTKDLGTLSESDFAIILGGLKDEYDGKDILIKDFYIYDTALDKDQVEKIFTNEKTYIAITEDGQVIGTYPEEMANATPEQREGWYFVNSGSEPADFYSPEIGTAKELKGLPANEVIKNEIDISKLPVTDGVKSNFEKAHAEKGNHGYIATSGKDFTGDGYLWTEDNKGSSNGSTVKVDGKGTEGSDYPVAITIPDGKERQITGYSPCVFFIDDCGFLRCFYNNGASSYHSGKYDKELRSGVSYVFKKEDDTNIKSEDLQYALGEFVAKLHNATPNSMLSAVRFSNQKVTADYKTGTPNVDIEGVTKNYDDNVLKRLVMLDWTSDTKEISQILSLERGDGGTTDTDPPTNTKGKDGLKSDAQEYDQYNYGMTGGTYTWTGFQAYTDFLDSQINYEGDDADPAKKYIILFTDGMDNMLDSSNENNEKEYAVKLANKLKEKGYTIFCVVLKNRSFDTGAAEGEKTRGERVRDYMTQIAGNKSTKGKTYDELSSGESQNRYIFEADDVEGLTEAFTGEILRQISSSLLDYTVRDYIDPRFDLVDGTGKTIVLKKGGASAGTIRNIDGAEAVLCYDTDKDRYYLEWVNQDIPGTTPGQNSLTVWSRTFRVIAKEDFIGGNAVLSNGKEKEENWVFNSSDTKSSSGITDAKVYKEDIDPVTQALKDPYVSKGFPRTAVNVRLLKPTIADAKDEIYMGEKIDPATVAKDIIKIVQGNCYWEYLKRYYSNDPLSELSSKKTTYANALEAAIKDLIANKSSFDINKYGSADGDLKKYLDTKGITLSADNSVHSLTVPYLYLPNEGGTNTVGKDKYLKDRVGEITYMIVQYEPEDKDELSSSTNIATTDAQKRKYLLWVQFKADDEKTRETAISTLVEDPDYKRDSEYKPAAGEEQVERHTEGPYEVDIVAGEIILECELDAETIAYLQNHFPDTTIKYSADLMRSYIGLAPSEKVGTFNVTIDCNNGKSTTKATFTPESSYEDRIPTYGLPIGEYTLANEKKSVVGTNKDLLEECFKFNTDNTAEAKDINGYYNDFTGYSEILPVSATYSDTEKANLAAEHTDKAIYLGWNGSAITTDYLKDRLGMFLIKGHIDTGTLSITKKIVGHSEPGAEFTFEVTINAVGSFDYKINDVPSGTIDATNNKITLKENETATIEGIPVGTKFTVKEEKTPGYTASYSAAETDTITKGGKTVTVTNTYNPYGELTLDIAKVIEGRDWIDSIDSFDFTIERTDTGKDDAVTMPETTTVTVKGNGTAEHTASFGKIIFNEPGDYTFTVTETSGNINSLTYDPTTYTVNVKVTNSSPKLTVNATYVTVTEGPTTKYDGSPLTFTNKVKPINWSFDVAKNLTGRDWLKGEAFTFKAEVSYEGTDTNVKTPVEFTSKDDTLLVKEAQNKATFGVNFNSKGKYTFTVTEEKGTDNNLIYDGKSHKIVVTVGADATTGALKVNSVTVDGEQSDADTTSLTITNEYKASASTSVSISKTLTGREWLDSEKFTFELVADPDDAGTVEAVNSGIITLPDSIDVYEDETKTFGTITFTDVVLDNVNGEYVKNYSFIIREQLPNGVDKDTHILNGITYDTRTYPVKVKITCNHDGTIETTTQVIGTTDNIATFKNTYTAAPAEWTPQVKKTLDGRDWIEGDSFTFTVNLDTTYEAGAVPDNYTLPSSNEITIGSAQAPDYTASLAEAIKFNAAGKYKFTISENCKDGNGLTYDKHVYNVEVKVIDNGKGQLEIESISYDTTNVEKENVADHKFSFTNTYTDKPVDWTVSINKTLDGREGDWLEDIDVFTFYIELQGDNTNVDMPTEKSVTIDKNSVKTNDVRSASFGNITFKQKGDYTFKVWEEKGTVGGIFYDSTEYILTVHVVSDNKGNLVISSVEYDTDADHQGVDGEWQGTSAEKVQLSFENHHSHTAVDWAPSVQKIIDGRGWETGDSFKFRITYNGTADKNKIVMPTDNTVSVNSEKSTPSFNKILFKEIGEYTFTVDEELTAAQTEQGLTKKSGPYTVVVSVKSYNGTETGHKDGELYIDAVTVDGEPAQNDVVLSFTNQYAVKGEVRWTPQVKKTLTGREWTAGDSFTFKVELTSGNGDTVDMPSSNEITIVGTTPDYTASLAEAIKFNAAGKYKFTISENGTDGSGLTYDKHVYNVTVTVEDDGMGHLVLDSVTSNSINYKDTPFEFVNKYETGTVDWTVSVEKQINDKEKTGRDENWTADDVFKFTIELTKGNADNVKFNGEKTVTLNDKSSIKDGTVFRTDSFGTVTFSKAGTYTFTVKEEKGSVGGITYDTAPREITVTVKDAGNGNLSIDSVACTSNGVSTLDNKTTTVQFTNTHQHGAVSWAPAISKTLAGRDWKPGESFSFTLEYLGEQVGADIVNDTHKVTNGKSTVTVTSQNVNTAFDSVSFHEIGTYVFTVYENDLTAAQTEQGLTKDETVYTIAVTVASEANGKLYIEKVTVDGEPAQNDVVLSFTNIYNASGTVSWTPQVKKTLTGREWTAGDSFTFKVELTSGNGDTVDMPSSNEITIGSTTPDYTASLADAIKFKAADTYTFAISEEGTDGNGLTYDKHVYNVTVIVEDDTVGGLKISQIAYNDKKNPNKTVSGNFNGIAFEFENIYKPTPVDWTPKVTKVIANKAVWNPDYTFDFTITPPSVGINNIFKKGTEELYTKNKITITDFDYDGYNHVKEFPAVTFKAAGIYEFTIKEEQGDISAVTYDTNPYTVIVTVEDVNGTLMITNVSGTDIGSDSNLTIMNTYSTSVPWPPVVEKTIDGRDWQIGDSFTFELLLDPDFPQDVGSVVMPLDPTITLTQADYDYASKKATGVFAVAVEFTNEGTYRFILREKIPENIYGNMIYDTSKYIITVEVTRDFSSGELSVTSSAMKQDATGRTQEAGGNYRFTNIYNKAEVPIYVHKELEGWKNGDSFTFDIALTSGNSDKVIMPESTSVTVTKGAPTASFGDITFTEAGEYTFTITEQVDSTKEDEIVYAAPQTVTVTVGQDPFTGKLTASVNGGYDNVNPSLKFTNYYVEDATLPVSVTKELEGWKDGDSFTFDIALTSGNSDKVILPESTSVTVTKGAPTASFGDITFTEAGEYTFTITEQVDSTKEDEIVYAAPQTVTVTVGQDPFTGKLTASVNGGYDNVNTPLKFTNYYVEDATLPVSVTKELEGWKDGDSFTFDIALTSGNSDKVIMPESTSVTVTKGAPTASFGDITFTEAGEYTFTITEQVDSTKVDEIVYADPQTVTVIVSQDPFTGKLTASVNGGYDNVNPSLKFTNYYVEDATLPVSVTKELEGWKDGDSFTFDIALTSGNSDKVILPESTSVTVTKGAPTASFGDITFTEAGEYTFTITEQVDSTKEDEIVYADPQTVTVTVSMDPLSNKLTASVNDVQYDVQNPLSFTFTNSYKTPVPPATGSLTVRKVLYINNTITEGVGQFRFRIELIDSDFTNEVFNDGVAEVTLAAGESITLEGLPAGTRYKVSEYSTYGYTLLESWSTNLSGTIPEGGEAKAVAVNVYVDTWQPPITPPADTPELEPPTEAKRSNEDSVESPNPTTGICSGAAAAMLLAAAAAIAFKRR